MIALDLSSASLARDMPPSRLAQARAKIATLLRDRSGGQVALVAYAGDAYTVAPLTDDAANVALFLDALQTDIKRSGQRTDRAIAWSCSCAPGGSIAATIPDRPCRCRHDDGSRALRGPPATGYPRWAWAAHRAACSTRQAAWAGPGSMRPACSA